MNTQAPEFENEILFISPECPFPTGELTCQRDAHLANLLARQTRVELLYPSSGSPDIDSDIATEPKQSGNLKLIGLVPQDAPAWRRLAAKIHPLIFDSNSHTIRQALRQRARHGKILWISQLEMGQYIPFAKELGYRVIWDRHGKTVSKAQHRYRESRHLNLADTVITTCNSDAKRVRKLAPQTSVHIIPNAIDFSTFDSVRDKSGSTLFFSGALDEPATLKGLLWFVREIMPRLRASLKTTLPRVVIAAKVSGVHADPATLKFKSFLESAGIEVHLNPPSILPLLSESAIVFNPNPKDVANRTRILEAMAAGRAVVSTGTGAEGLVLVPSFNIWIANQADGFTSALLRLIDDPTARQQMGLHASKTVQMHFDWSCASSPLKSVLFELQRAASERVS